ncbi:hypothetical protein MNV49_001111 [Pseudohyphozyma bogoriensis]|nr:hypothetical protein MNV49_001111 [Pseudohyphozyma bogoriensis]
MAGNKHINLYGYTPSKPLAIVAGVLFAITFFAHLGFMIKRRSWYWIAFTIGCAMESIGYFVRYASSSNPESVATYAIQSLMVILAPSLMAASHYMVFGRMMRQVGEQYSLVRASRVTKIFVALDVVSFLIQGGGGGIQASGNSSSANTGKYVLIVGFALQLVSFAIFGIFTVIYRFRARKDGVPTGPWTKCLAALYTGIVLILIRSVYRMVEFSSSTGYNTGYLLTHEALYYVLEALPIFAVTVFYLLCHPARYLNLSSNPNVTAHYNDNSNNSPNSDLALQTSEYKYGGQSATGYQPRDWDPQGTLLLRPTLSQPRADGCPPWQQQQEAIATHGQPNASSQPSCTYGVLFDKTANTLEALNGTLRAAKRQKKVAFDAELLMMPKDKDVVVVWIGE